RNRLGSRMISETGFARPVRRRRRRPRLRRRGSQGPVSSSWVRCLRFVDRAEVAATGGIHFEPRTAIQTVDHPSIGRAAVPRIERDGGKTIAFIRFPLVDLAVLIDVLFRADETVAFVELGARDLA